MNNRLQHTQRADTYELLSTKFVPPRLGSSLVPREALLERLDEGLEHKLTVLSAPAGFGKTTLVSKWVATRCKRQDGREVAWVELDTINKLTRIHPQEMPRLGVAWVALDAGDNDPVRFWRYTFTACQTFEANVGIAALALLTSQRPHYETVLTSFINDLAQLEDRCVLILEDYHAITSPQVHETVAFLLDHLPPTLHLILLTRNDPPLPLARLRAHDDLYELHVADLCFSGQEARAFLQQSIPFQLSSELMLRLEARTEGWVTGLRLIVLALRGRQNQSDIEHLLSTFTGTHRHILEYLVAEVLASQPGEVQEFLLQTTFLSRLSGPLCDAVTGGCNSDTILEELERSNLFLMPLDGAQQWYRYHALFAEAIHHYARRRLGDDTLHELSRKASLWYEAQGFMAEAIESAFSAQDFARAATLIESISELLSTGEVYTVLRWCGQLPENELPAHPRLSLSYAVALLFTSDRSAPATRDLVEVPLAMAERYWQAKQNKPELGLVQAVRAQVAWWQGDVQQAFVAARTALAWLPEQDQEWRGSCLLIIGLEALLNGKYGETRKLLLAGRTLCEAARNGYAARAATLSLADLNVWQGDLQQAALLYQQILVEAGDDISDQAHAWTGLAELSLERNDLEAAEQLIAQTLALIEPKASLLGKQHVDKYLREPCSLLLARIEYARGQVREARQRLLEFHSEPRQYVISLRPGDLQLWQIRFALALGDQAMVQRWFTSALQEGDFPLYRERVMILQGRWLMAQGKFAEALSWLEAQQIEAQRDQHRRSELEIRLLKALTYTSLDRVKEARQELRIVLVRALPEGYQRLFLDEGEPMETLLRAVLLEVKEEPLLAYVQALLQSFPHRWSGQQNLPPAPEDFFIEPLSSQERRVLRLLIAGRSNPEMAQELIVSVNTIKTQVKSIYRKLNVGSRQEAREVAKRLKLL